MRPLIAVITCHKNQIAAHAQRTTWAAGHPVAFFYGAGNRSLQFSDEVFVPANDGYLSLPYKVQEMIRWALKYGYAPVFKCDDDAYVVPERLFSSDFLSQPYVGNFSEGYAHGGAGYGLSEDAMKVLASAPVFGKSEDGWVAKTLYRAGFSGEHDNRYQYVRRVHGDPLPTLPSADNDLISTAEFSPEEMKKVHRLWTNPPDPIEAMSADEYKKYLKGSHGKL